MDQLVNWCILAGELDHELRLPALVLVVHPLESDPSCSLRMMICPIRQYRPVCHSDSKDEQA